MESFHYFGDLLCLDFDNNVNNGSSSVSKVSAPITEVPNRGFNLGQEHISSIETEVFDGEEVDDEKEDNIDEKSVVAVGESLEDRDLTLTAMNGAHRGGGGGASLSSDPGPEDTSYANLHQDGHEQQQQQQQQQQEEEEEEEVEEEEEDEDEAQRGEKGGNDEVGHGHDEVGHGGAPAADAETPISAPALSRRSLSPDEQIERATMLCLRYLVKPDKLPILASNLWFLVQRSSVARFELEGSDSAEAEAARGEDNGNIDIKRSSFKKVSNYFASLEKRGVLTLQTTEDGITSVLTLDTSHIALRGHKAKDPVEFKAVVYGTSTRTNPNLNHADDDRADFRGSQNQSQGRSSRGQNSLDDVEVLSLTKLPKSLAFIPCDEIPEDRVFPGNKVPIGDAKVRLARMQHYIC
jgi:hypothetical protein